MGWLYFIAQNDEGKVLVIARRNAVPSPSIPGHTSWGPIIQVLSRDEGWIDRPSLLTRFHDPGYLEPVTAEQAHAAAAACGAAWFASDDDPDPSFPSPKRGVEPCRIGGNAPPAIACVPHGQRPKPFR